METIKKIPLYILIFLVIIWIIGNQISYIITPQQQSILVQLGKPVGESKTKPGLYFKMPFIQNVMIFISIYRNS